MTPFRLKKRSFGSLFLVPAIGDAICRLYSVELNRFAVVERSAAASLFSESLCHRLPAYSNGALSHLILSFGNVPDFDEDSDMTELRNRMDEAMVLRGFSLRTRETYLACVRALAKHYRQPPDVLDGRGIQAYLLHLITERKLAYASVNQASCAFRFLFGTVLRRPEIRFDIPMAKVPKRLPQILSREQVTRLIEAAATLRGRTLLTTTYAAGLRVSEVCALQLADIEMLRIKPRSATSGP